MNKATITLQARVPVRALAVVARRYERKVLLSRSMLVRTAIEDLANLIVSQTDITMPLSDVEAVEELERLGLRGLQVRDLEPLELEGGSEAPTLSDLAREAAERMRHVGE